MLMWALLFFILSFIVGSVGFVGVAAASTGVAQMLFFVFLVMTGITFGSFLMTR